MYDSIDDVEVYYTYNADGIRTQKDVNGTVTYYTLDGSKIISQKTGNNEIFFEYDASGQVKCITYNGATYYYVYNMLGDIIGLSNVAGNLVVTYEYHPYGEIKEYTDTSGINLANINPFRYKGYYFDTETGLYYLNSRYYDPELCRFLNADGVISGSGSSVHGYNLFAYCFNNPVNLNDADGNWPSWSDIKKAAKKAINKVGDFIEAVASSIQVEVGAGFGFGYSVDTTLVDAEFTAYQDSLTLGVSNGDSYTAIKGAASAGVTIAEVLPIEANVEYEHFFEQGLRRDWDEHTTMSTPWEVWSCEKTHKKKQLLFDEKIVTQTPCEDNYVIGFGMSYHCVIGGHFYIGIDVTNLIKVLQE